MTLPLNFPHLCYFQHSSKEPKSCMCRKFDYFYCSNVLIFSGNQTSYHTDFNFEVLFTSRVIMDHAEMFTIFAHAPMMKYLAMCQSEHRSAFSFSQVGPKWWTQMDPNGETNGSKWRFQWKTIIIKSLLLILLCFLVISWGC